LVKIGNAGFSDTNYASLLFKYLDFPFSLVIFHSARQRLFYYTVGKMYALSKLNKQHEQTWVNLQKRLNEVQFPYRKLFSTTEIYDFVKNKAVSVGSCEGYFVPSILTTTAYLLACNQARVQTLTHNQPLNIFTIFVGYPGTGKSLYSNFIAFQVSFWPKSSYIRVIPLNTQYRRF